MKRFENNLIFFLYLSTVIVNSLHLTKCNIIRVFVWKPFFPHIYVKEPLTQNLTIVEIIAFRNLHVTTNFCRPFSRAGEANWMLIFGIILF